MLRQAQHEGWVSGLILSLSKDEAARVLTRTPSSVTSPLMIEITQEFGFDAAHFLENAPQGSNRRMHGHSFYAEVTLKGEADRVQGWVRDFGEVNAVLAGIRETLDHCLLNDIEGLGQPTLENLARYIYGRAKTQLPEVCRVRLRRPSHGQSCVFEGQ